MRENSSRNQTEGSMYQLIIGLVKRGITPNVNVTLTVPMVKNPDDDCTNLQIDITYI